MNEIQIDEAIGKAIKAHVNGKIDTLTKLTTENHEIVLKHIEDDAEYQKKDLEFKAKMTAHMEETRPYLEAATGIKRIGDIIIYVRNISLSLGGIALMWYALANRFHL